MKLEILVEILFVIFLGTGAVFGWLAFFENKLSYEGNLILCPVVLPGYGTKGEKVYVFTAPIGKSDPCSSENVFRVKAERVKTN